MASVAASIVTQTSVTRAADQALVSQLSAATVTGLGQTGSAATASLLSAVSGLTSSIGAAATSLAAQTSATQASLLNIITQVVKKALYH